jgi:twitching motility protein PilT
MPALDQYFHAMVAQKASDFHLSSGNCPMFRVSGTITAVGKEILRADAVKSLIYEIMPERNRVEWEQCNDSDFAYELSGVGRFRCNVFSDSHGIGAVFRLIPSRILGFKELGLPDSIKKLCFLQKGIVLVTGPTGSGKSTTLAAIIDFVNQHREDHVITIEDPIEFVHQNKRCLINQREIYSHTESFTRALRAVLREDPDIVLVGEMRDLETVRITLETAETGHLVFGTLHTNSAHSTVDRLINMFPADEQSQVRSSLADSLKGVVSQGIMQDEGRRPGRGPGDSDGQLRPERQHPRRQTAADPQFHSNGPQGRHVLAERFAAGVARQGHHRACGGLPEGLRQR